MKMMDRLAAVKLDTWGRQFAAALLWASLWALSYPRPNLWILSHVALVPLTLLAIRASSTWRLIRVVYPVSLLWWGGMLYWLIEVTGPGEAALAAYMAIYPLAYAWMIRRVFLRFPKLPLMVTMPVIWVGLEYVRSWALSGFPWYMLGHSQPWGVLNLAVVFGAYGVSFWVACSNAWFVNLLLGRKQRHLLSYAWLYVGFFIIWIVFGDPKYSIHGESIRIALIQSNVPQSNKDSGKHEDDEKTFAELMELSRRSLAEKPDLIVWPETIVPKALNDESMVLFEKLGLSYGKYRKAIEDFARENKVYVLVGAHAMIEWHATKDGAYRAGRRYNSAYLFDPKGQMAGRYDKIHRVPFGEYIPWVDHSPWLKKLLLQLTPYESDYSLTPGDQYTVFTLNLAPDRNDVERICRITVPICYEDVVSDVPWKMVFDSDGKRRADVLVNISNDGWYAGLAQGPQHEQIARFRCVENGVPMARAINTGASGFITWDGEIEPDRVMVNGKTQEVAGVVVSDLRYGRSGDRPWWWNPDWLGIACQWLAAGLLAMSWAWRGRKADLN